MANSQATTIILNSINTDITNLKARLTALEQVVQSIVVAIMETTGEMSVEQSETETSPKTD